MQIIEKLKEFLYGISTLSVLGPHPLGGVVASLLVFPIVFAGRALYFFSVDLFYNLFLVLMLLFLATIRFVLDSLPFDRRGDILINQMMGMGIGYYYVPLVPKFIILALLVFHSLRLIIPTVIRSHWNIDILAYPGLTGLLLLDLLTGVATNFCMHLLRFFAW